MDIIYIRRWQNYWDCRWG